MLQAQTTAFVCIVYDARPTAVMYKTLTRVCAAWYTALRSRRRQHLNLLVALIEQYHHVMTPVDWAAVAHNPAVDLRIYTRWRNELLSSMISIIKFSHAAADFIRMNVDDARACARIMGRAHVDSSSGQIDAVLKRYGSFRRAVYCNRWHRHEVGPAHRWYKFYDLLHKISYADMCALNAAASSADTAYVYGRRTDLPYICPLCAQKIRDLPLTHLRPCSLRGTRYTPGAPAQKPVITLEFWAVNCNLTLDFALANDGFSHVGHLIQNTSLPLDILRKLVNCGAFGVNLVHAIIKQYPIDVLEQLWPSAAAHVGGPNGRAPNVNWRTITGRFDNIPLILQNPHCSLEIIEQHMPALDGALLRNILRVAGSGFAQHPDKLASYW